MSEQSYSRITNTIKMEQSQQIANSVILQLEDPKNSRIINRKQIQKRLQNMKPSQYEKVISNLTQQNKKLQQQVTDLHVKVQHIMLTKKIQNPHHKNPLMQEQVRKAKKQLALKYQSMNYLKQMLRKAKQSQLTQQMKIKRRQYRDQMVNIQSERENLLKQKIKLAGIYQANTEHLQQYHPKQENRDQRMKSLRQQNKNLLAKIRQINDNQKVTHKNSQSALQKFYNLKVQEQQFKALKSGKKNVTLSDIKGLDTSQLNTLKKQVQQLKQQKKQAEQRLVSQSIKKHNQKAMVQKQAKQSLQIHKQLLLKKTKLTNQLNMYETKDRRHKQAVLMRQQKKQQKKVQQKGIQTDKIIPIDFRKQWFGKNQGIAFDDSLILDYRSHVYIKSFIIYKTADFIGFIKFFYQNSQKKRYETKVPFDQTTLRKFESKKYVSKGDTYLRSYNLSLTNDLVTKIEFIWSDGEVVSQGWQSESSVKFSADIDAGQRPISMFGTLSFQGKTSYALQSLGCQINKNEQDA